MAGKQRYFSLMAGVGVDGAIVGGVGKREKQLLKRWACAALWHVT
jgi:diacylglycerol kinase family enzyme